MRRREHIKAISIFLLLTYLFVNTPFVFLHHHHFSVKGETSFGFSSDTDKGAQLDTFKDRCLLCDFHFVTEHKPAYFFFSPIKIEAFKEKPLFYSNFYTSYSFVHLLNKDPPLRV